MMRVAVVFGFAVAAVALQVLEPAPDEVSPGVRARPAHVGAENVDMARVQRAQ